MKRQSLLLKCGGALAGVGVICGSMAMADPTIIPLLEKTLLCRAASLAMSADDVGKHFVVTETQTNGSLCDITARHRVDNGTNYVFSFSSGFTSPVIRVICQDASTNRCIYWYYPNGTLRRYEEDGDENSRNIFATFHTNSQVRQFMIFSNDFAVGAYEYDANGKIIFSVTNPVPIQLQF